MDLIINGSLTECSTTTVINFLRQNNLIITSLKIKLNHGIRTEQNLQYLLDMSRSIAENLVLEELQLLEDEAISVGDELSSNTILTVFSNFASNLSLRKLFIDWTMSKKTRTHAFSYIKNMLHYNHNLQYFGNGTFLYAFLGVDVGEMLLLPLLLRDSPLQHLDLSKGDFEDNNLRLFVSVFTKYPEMAPTELNLSHSNYEHTIASEILPKLVSMERITKINFSSNKLCELEPMWMVHVATSITLRNIPLELLDLGDNQLTDKDIARMMDIFKQAPNMLPKNLILSKNCIGLPGACSVAEVLSLVEYPLTLLDLSETRIGYVGGLQLIELFNKNANKVPKIFNMSNLTGFNLGLREFTALAEADNPIVEFNISQQCKDGEVDFGWDHGDCFQEFIEKFTNKNVFPMRLVIDNINIEVDTVCSLLAWNSSLKSLSWVTEMELWKLENDEITKIFESLSSNTSLEELMLCPEITITQNGWNSLAKLLCNMDGEIDTRTSNHTLRKFSPLSIENASLEVSERINYCLELNSKYEALECGMLKLVKYHFAKHFDMSKFCEFPSHILVELLCCLQKWMPKSESQQLDYFNKMRVLRNRTRMDDEDQNLFTLTYILTKLFCCNL